MSVRKWEEYYNTETEANEAIEKVAKPDQYSETYVSFGPTERQFVRKWPDGRNEGITLWVVGYKSYRG